MPELPDVETVCRVMRRVLVGQRIARVEVVRDPLVLSGHAPRTVERALVGRVVDAIGRRGKIFWITLRGPGPTLFGHLGMTGWIREDDGEARPRFLRLRLETQRGKAIAFTDARRFGRIWLGPSPERDRRVARLGRDALDDLPPTGELAALLRRHERAIKAVLLDQSVLAGIGNWIADEVLYQSRIAPARKASSLTNKEVSALRSAIRAVVTRAVRVEADAHRFPRSWLFEHRWGGSRGADRIGGHRIVRDVVGGRTTAWVPALQR